MIRHTKTQEEINLLYVAITRTKNKLYIPETLMPKEFPGFPFIHVLKETAVEEDKEYYLQDYKQPGTTIYICFLGVQKLAICNTTAVCRFFTGNNFCQHRLYFRMMSNNNNRLWIREYIEWLDRMIVSW